MNIKEIKSAFKKREIHKFGHLIFTFGVLLVILFSLSDPTKLTVNKAVLLLILGLVIGFIDVPKKEANSFIIAAIAIIVASLAHYEQITYSLFNMAYPLGLYIKGTLLNASILLSPAILIVALKIIYRVYKE